jgi:hypothetical protein
VFKTHHAVFKEEIDKSKELEPQVPRRLQTGVIKREERGSGEENQDLYEETF